MTFSGWGLLFTSVLIIVQGPQTFRPNDAPRYLSAEIFMIACCGACIVDLLFIYWFYQRQNRRKAAIRAQPQYRKVENQEWLDLTDWENAELVYEV